MRITLIAFVMAALTVVTIAADVAAMTFCCDASGTKNVDLSWGDGPPLPVELTISVHKCLQAESPEDAAGEAALYWYWYAVDHPDDAVLVDSDTIVCSADAAPLSSGTISQSWDWPVVAPRWASMAWYRCRMMARPNPPTSPGDLVYRWIESPLLWSAADDATKAGWEAIRQLEDKGRTREHPGGSPFGCGGMKCYVVAYPPSQSTQCCELVELDDECEWTSPG